MYFIYYPHLPEKLTIIYTVYKISLSIERSNRAVTENTTSKYAQTTQENVAVLCLVAQSRPTLCDPKDCGPPGSTIHRDFSGKNTGVGCHALLHGIFPIQGWNPDLPHCRRILHSLSHREAPRKRWVLGNTACVQLASQVQAPKAGEIGGGSPSRQYWQETGHRDWVELDSPGQRPGTRKCGLSQGSKTACAPPRWPIKAKGGGNGGGARKQEVWRFTSRTLQEAMEAYEQVQRGPLKLKGVAELGVTKR